MRVFDNIIGIILLCMCINSAHAQSDTIQKKTIYLVTDWDGKRQDLKEFVYFMGKRLDCKFSKNWVFFIIKDNGFWIKGIKKDSLHILGHYDINDWGKNELRLDYTVGKSFSSNIFCPYYCSILKSNDELILKVGKYLSFKLVEIYPFLVQDVP